MKHVNATLRRSIAAAAVVLAGPALASCGFNYATDQAYTPTEGVYDRSGSVDVLNVAIVSGENGSGTLIAGLVDDEDGQGDTLTEVTGAGEDLTITVESSPVEIPEGGFVQLADEGNITVHGDQVVPGRFVTVQFSFENSQSVTLDVPVVTADESIYGEVPLPSES